MTQLPLKELKENLSLWTEKASKGETIQVTKYNKPFIVMGPAKPHGLHVGKKVGKHDLKPVLKKGLGGLALKYLQEDRDGR